MPTVMQWTEHLLAKIDAQVRYAAPYEARYKNTFTVPFVEREYRDVYGSRVDALRPQLDAPRTGRAAVVVDALTERLTVEGATSDDAEAARVVQEAWVDNDLDVMHREAHREALIKACSFANVHRDTTNSKAVVGIESPEQMAVHRMAAPPYDVDASLKVSVDEWTGEKTGLLRLPGRDLRLVRAEQPVLDPEDPRSGRVSRWVVAEDGETATRLPYVPTVEFASRARLLAAPQSEIEPVATLVDLGDLIEALMVFAGHFGAVPIRWATGVSALTDEAGKLILGADGKPQIGFKPRSDHAWIDSNPEAKFGQMVPASLESFVTWSGHSSALLRAKTSLASTYFSLDLKSHMSAELLKTDEAPMVRRVLGMGRDGAFGQSWRRVDRMILAIERPESQARVWPRWADPETRIEAQATDSFQKQVASGLGVAATAEKTLGWDKETVNRAVEEAREAQERAAETDPLVRTTRAINDLSGQ